MSKKLTVLVLNFSGNAGKSVISRHLLEPRLNAKVVSVETLNYDEHETEGVAGEEFSLIMDSIFSIDDSVVIDVGASNVEVFIGEMRKVIGAQEDIDYFVIPTWAETKTQKDTLKTIDALSSLGVPAEKIRLVFNKVKMPLKPRDGFLRDEFIGIFDYHADNLNFVLNPDLIISHSDLYDSLEGKTIAEILNDERDYKEEANNQNLSREERQYLRSLLTRRRVAEGVSPELDRVFNALFD